MPYTKTSWVDGSAPAISASNLNKIEQGIADSFRTDGTTTMSGQMVVIGGSSATPSIVSTLDADTGVLFPSAGRMSIASSGTDVIYCHSNLNVGIGHNAPTAKLDVSGAVQVRGSASAGAVITISPDITTGTNGTTIANSFASGGYGPLYIQNGGSTRITIGVGGNIGIGVTPSVRLHIQSSGEVLRLETTTARGSGNNLLQFNDPTGQKGYFGYASASTDSFYIVNAMNAPMLFGVNGGESMRIDTNGNLGIGISPNQKLHVYDANAAIQLNEVASGGTGVSSSRLKYGLNYYGWYVGSTNAMVLYDYQASAERLRISSNGSVGIGTTGNTTRKLEIDASGIAVPPLRLTNANNNVGIEYVPNATYYSFLTATSYNASNTFEITPSTAAGGTTYTTPALTIRSNGNIGMSVLSSSYLLQLGLDSAAKPSTNTWTIASDERVKNVTGEYTKGLDAICSLRPVTYEYNGKAGFAVDGKENISIIAQEAIVHFPECVGTFNAKLEETDEQETELYNWNGHAITFALINAVKELNAKVEALEAQLKA